MKMKLLASLLLFGILGMSSILRAQGSMAVKDDHSVMTSEKTIHWDSKMIDLGPIQKIKLPMPPLNLPIIQTNLWLLLV